MIENINIIKEQMEAQNKGLRTLAEELGMSEVTIQKVRKGENVTISTLEAVANALGYKIVLVRDNSLKQTVYERKKPIRRNAKKPVPRKRNSNQ